MRQEARKMRAGRTALLLCGALLAALPVCGQDAGGPPAAPPPGQHGPGRPGGGPGEGMRAMLEKLDLTPEQEKQVHAVMESERPKMEALRDNSSLDQKDRRKEMMKIHEDAISRIKPILTEEQRKKFDEEQKHMREHMREGRGGRGGGMGMGEGNPPAPPPPQ